MGTSCPPTPPTPNLNLLNRIIQAIYYFVCEKTCSNLEKNFKNFISQGLVTCNEKDPPWMTYKVNELPKENTITMSYELEISNRLFEVLSSAYLI